MELKSIEDRLHAKADAELKNEVRKLCQDITNLNSYGEFNEISLMTTAQMPVEAYFQQTMERIEKFLFASLQKRRRDEAVAEFIRSVEQTYNQIQELKEGLSNE